MFSQCPTFIKEGRVFPYIFRNSALMSSISISARATMILISTLSVVPKPWEFRNKTTYDFWYWSYPYHVQICFHLPSLTCRVFQRKTRACFSCISLQRLIDALYIKVGSWKRKNDWNIAINHDWPIARNASSREPDISLFMLSSMSRPEIFWYSWNTGKRWESVGCNTAYWRSMYRGYVWIWVMQC